MTITETIILIAGTMGIIYLSWVASIKNKRYHGVYRFFSFESILFLVLLNYPEWFKDPFSPLQVISWLLLFSSLICAILGFYLLLNRGQPEKQMEDTTRLVSTGLYKQIRHPLYLSLMLGGLGIFLKDIDYIQAVIVLINMISLLLTAKVEEAEMIKKFGSEYTEYMKTTKMFLPYIF